MSNASHRADLSITARSIQIIVSALVAGPALLLGIAFLVRANGGLNAAPRTPILTYVAIGLAVQELLLFFFVPNLAVANIRRKIVAERRESGRPHRMTNVARAELVDRASDAGRLAAAFQTKTIISCALLEGAAIFTNIAFLIEGNPISLALSPLLIAGVAAHFPTQARVENWVEDQLRLAEHEVQLGN